jgi:hypothetical protein
MRTARQAGPTADSVAVSASTIVAELLDPLSDAHRQL